MRTLAWVCMMVSMEVEDQAGAFGPRQSKDLCSICSCTDSCWKATHRACNKQWYQEFCVMFKAYYPRDIASNVIKYGQVSPWDDASSISDMSWLFHCLKPEHWHANADHRRSYSDQVKQWIQGRLKRRSLDWHAWKLSISIRQKRSN